MIIDTDRKCSIPKYICTFSKPRAGIITAVTRVKPRAIASKIAPLLKLFLDRVQEIPQIKMNIPAKNGSTGIKKSKSASAHSHSKKEPSIKKA